MALDSWPDDFPPRAGCPSQEATPETGPSGWRGVSSLLAWALLGLLIAGWLSGVRAAEPGRAHELLNPQGRVEVLRKGANVWVPATNTVALFPGDAVRTGKDSRAAIRLANDSVIRLDQLSVLRLPERVSPRRRFVINLLKGAAYFFHRERPVETDFETPLVSGAIRGTEFNLAVEENGRTVLTLLDGEVELSNAQGQLTMRTGAPLKLGEPAVEEAVVEPGAAPRKSAVVQAINIIQWCLYYPAVLDADELALSDAERQALAGSLAAYRSGDLIQALAIYPANRQPTSAPEKVYLAQLQLSVGQVTQAEQLLNTVAKGDSAASQAEALRLVIDAVKFVAAGETGTDNASGLLANSYAEQSWGELVQARRSAQAAVARSPKFGFAWARLAELEFSFGRTAQARKAIDEALQLSPRHAQAHAINGFLLAAQRNFSYALQQFDEAIGIDSALANAWLGRGLVRIRQGHSDAGRDDLLVAAGLEPNRALLRSYLGKAFNQIGDDARAVKEFDLAKRIDANDPTPWLYSALLNQQQNRINEAIDDLEKSAELNENRRIYRSRLLLDEDRSVRGANLASIYEDAGFQDTSFREAARSANVDYANYSSHLFLANSYNQLRDPKQVNLRYEAPWLSEYLLANLLAPPDAGALSQSVSQQEYSRFFEQNRVGVVASGEYQSSGDWSAGGVQYGLYNNMAYAAEGFYRSQNGQRPNNDLTQVTVSLQLKEQITPSDGVYFQGVYYRATGGDLRQYYDQNQAANVIDPTTQQLIFSRFRETQEPLLIGGWHHEWSPESHTLFLAGRLQDTFTLNSLQPVVLRQYDAFGQLSFVDQFPVPLDYRNELEIYTTELQQIWQHEEFTLIGGGRFQIGDFDTRNALGSAAFLPPQNLNTSTDFERAAVYGYGHLRPIDSLLLIAGLSYDWLKYPENFRSAPISSNERQTDRVSPKAGIIWTPWRDTTLRAAYTRSLGGVAFDRSFQLEPSQIAGFSQNFRSLIPESVKGALSAERYQTYGVALDQKFPTRTYVGVSAELLESKSDQSVGTIDYVLTNTTISTIPERLKFREKSLRVSLNQLVGDEWSFGTQYRLTYARLEDIFTDIGPNITTFGSFNRAQTTSATLHQVSLFGIFNHPSGFFTQAEGIWSSQDNSSSAQPGDHFWQVNAFVGCRFLRRHAELTFGLLNITDRDYHLNPLTLYSELPRERTAVMALKINF